MLSFVAAVQFLFAFSYFRLSSTQLIGHSGGGHTIHSPNSSIVCGGHVTGLTTLNSKLPPVKRIRAFRFIEPTTIENSANGVRLSLNSVYACSTPKPLTIFNQQWFHRNDFTQLIGSNTFAKLWTGATSCGPCFPFRSNLLDYLAKWFSVADIFVSDIEAHVTRSSNESEHNCTIRTLPTHYSHSAAAMPSCPSLFSLRLPLSPFASTCLEQQRASWQHSLRANRSLGRYCARQTSNCFFVFDRV